MNGPLLEVDNLVVDFATRNGTARVLDHVSLQVNAGEVLGIVGESGCGKSMTALSILGLVPTPVGKIVAGSVKLAGEQLVGASSARMRALRGGEISMIFQEPMTSLNPVFRVGEQIVESIVLHSELGKEAAAARAVEMLRAVGIPEPELRARAYPHQLSGGMRQRVMIAIALACNPAVLIADEPTTALDVTVQAQIFDLLDELRRDTGTAIVLITHDMGVIANMADRVLVMYAGRVVEQGTVDDILDRPAHPYTRGLIACVPHLESNPGIDRPPLQEIPGVVPALTELGPGCSFAPRCEQAFDRCREVPPIKPVQPLERLQSQRLVRCWAAHEEAP